MKKYALLISFIVGWFYGSAQTSHLYFDEIGIKDGLPESNVRTIKEDAGGYIWIATQNGLVRYDGYQYKVYYLGSDKLNIRPTTNIQSILITRDNTVWISTNDNGIFRYNRPTDTFTQFAYPPSKSGETLFIETADNAGNLWARFFDGKAHVAKFDVITGKFEIFDKEKKGTHYLNIVRPPFIRNLSDGIWLGDNINGLYHYEGPEKPFKEYLTNTDTAKQRGVNPIYEAPSQPGILWLNTFHGNNLDLRLTRLDVRANSIREFKAANKPDSLASAAINGIYEDKQKRFWIATETGLSELNRKSGVFTNYVSHDTVKSPAKNNLSAFIESPDGKLWLTSGTGLVNFDPANGHFENYLPDNNNAGAINSANIVSKLIDHTGRLWLTYYFAGISKENKIKSAFRVIKQTQGNPAGRPEGINKVVPAKKGFSFVNNGHAIYSWVNGTNSFKLIYAVDKGLSIEDFILGPDGNLYMGTTNGLIVYNSVTGKKEIYKANPADNNSLNFAVAEALFQDHTGIIWVAMGLGHGLCSFDPQTRKFTRYSYNRDINLKTAITQGPLDDSQVICMYEDHENVMWFGTNNGSANRFDRKTGKFFSYFNNNTKQMFCIVGMYEDSAGRFWVGSYLNGLFELDRRKGIFVHHLDERSGLLYNGISDIREDNSGYILVFSSRGISRLNPKTLEIKNFELSKILPGYQSLNLNGNMFKLTGDTLVTVLSGALAIFDPRNLDNDPYPPIVHLENINYSNPLSDDKKVSHMLTYGVKSTELPYNQNRLQFNYVGIQFDDPSQNTYAYKLDNYDKQWVQAGTSRSVTYNNLSPGTYVFHVIAANSSGVWNYKGDSITIIIASPWWLRWWAWVLYVVLFVWAIYAFIAYRSRQLLRENKVLEEKVDLRTAELSEANKELSEQREEIITQRDRLEETVVDLKATQTQLIQAEKMASLGELTAGIAHEIQNPLNFVNNFSEVSIELIDEMQSELAAGDKDEAIEIANDVKANLEKIRHHGKRADFIVKGMLQHSRTSTGERQLTNINTLADEFLKLSFHGLRAKNKSFNAEMLTNFDPSLPKINVIQQDIGRVLLNLFNNAFYAVAEKQKTTGSDYKPTVTVSTMTENKQVVIKVKDNGSGIPDNIKDKIMQPFFTTKPTGEGTGLGLSLSYDMIVKGHNGSINIVSTQGDGAEFIITLPIG